jgi:hypothetical protein
MYPASFLELRALVGICSQAKTSAKIFSGFSLARNLQMERKAVFFSRPILASENIR